MSSKLFAQTYIKLQGTPLGLPFRTFLQKRQFFNNSRLHRSCSHCRKHTLINFFWSRNLLHFTSVILFDWRFLSLHIYPNISTAVTSYCVAYKYTHSDMSARIAQRGIEKTMLAILGAAVEQLNVYTVN